MIKLFLETGHFLHGVTCGPLQLINIKFRAWISDYIFTNAHNVITHPCPNFNNSLAKVLLKLGPWVSD